MLKTINILSFILLIITGFLVLFTYQEDMDVHIQNINYYFITLSILFSLLLIIKWNIRWQILFLKTNNKTEYIISDNGFKNTLVYESITIVFYLLLGGIILYYQLPIWYLGIIIFLFFIEGIAHLLYTKLFSPYRIIITPNAVIVVANDIKIVKWNRIKKVEKIHNDLQFFDKYDNITLIDLDLISKNDAQKATKDILRIAKEKNIYFGFKN